jgi:hypothetical protein
MLATFAKSKEDYYHQYVKCDVQRPRSKQHMLAGSIAHAILLEGKTLEDSIAIYPFECLQSNGSLNGKKAAAFREENEGKLCLKAGEADEFVAMADHLRNSEIAKLIAKMSHKEHIVTESYNGRGIKCRPDAYNVDGLGLLAIDLKFVGEAKPRQFERTASSFTYWLQDAHYSEVLFRACGLPVTFRFFAIETSYPFRVDEYEYDQRSKEIARENWESLMDSFIECERTGGFDDNHSHTLTLNIWDVDANEDGEIVEYQGSES